MSIVDSALERANAETQVSTRDDASLRDDLVWWTLASRDHEQEHCDLADRQAVVRRQWAESATWVALISDELAKRRPRRAP